MHLYGLPVQIVPSRLNYEYQQRPLHPKLGGSSLNDEGTVICLVIYLNLQLSVMGAQWSQFFPPNAQFTAADVPSLDGKVFLITGGGHRASGMSWPKCCIRDKPAYIYSRSFGRARSQGHQTDPGQHG
ncbi:hypothetical protein GGS20DRAFT_543573 [Poronia punctata]|nr:hypothetical protein GGS20DRAFT_543573 [Poronia punctata]